MSLSQANKEKTRSSCRPPTPTNANNLELLPSSLRGLDRASQTLQTKVRRLDATITTASPRPQDRRPVITWKRQLGLLKAPFGAESV